MKFAFLAYLTQIQRNENEEFRNFNTILILLIQLGLILIIETPNFTLLPIIFLHYCRHYSTPSW